MCEKSKSTKMCENVKKTTSNLWYVKVRNTVIAIDPKFSWNWWFCCFRFQFWWVVLPLVLILLLACWCSRFVTCVAIVDEYWCVGVVDLSVVVVDVAVVVVVVVRVGVDEERLGVWRHGYGYGAMVWLRLGSAEADQPSREEGGPCGQQLVATLSVEHSTLVWLNTQHSTLGPEDPTLTTTNCEQLFSFKNPSFGSVAAVVSFLFPLVCTCFHNYHWWFSPLNVFSYICRLVG